MADREVKARISLEDQLTPALLKVQGALENFHGGTVSLAAGLELLKDAGELAKKGFEFLEGQMHKAFEEALEGEKATNRLKGAMVQAGIYTAELSETLEKHVNTLEETVGANGEAVKSMIATGLQMGLNIEKAQELERAARQLAAANGIDVNEAFSILNSSLAGNARALGKLVPQVKELGAAQLKQGDAIALVNQATAAQYDLYQKSLPAALDKSKVALDNVYKAVGLTITQSPALTSALNAAIQSLNQLTKWVEANQEAITTWVNGSISDLLTAMSVLTNTFDVLYRTGTAAFNGIASVINASMAAVAKSLDIVVQGLSYLPGSAGEAAKAAHEVLSGFTDVTWAAAKQNVDNVNNAIENQTKVSQALDSALINTRDAVDAASASHKANAKAMDDSLVKTSALAAANLNLQQTYDGFTIGTFKQREALTAQVQQRDNDLKDFTAYLDAKKRLAVSKQEEQDEEVDKVTAAAMKGSGGAGEKQSGANVAVDAEIKKQAELDVLYQKGLLSRQQYDEATRASDARAAAAELDFDQAHALAKATALGQTQEALQLKQQQADQQFQLDMQTKVAQATEEDATQAEIDAMRAAANQAHLAEMAAQKEAFIENDAAQNEKLGNQWAVSLDKIALMQQKHGAVMGTLLGVQQSTEFKTVSGGLGNLANLRNSHSKTAFDVGKKAAIAQATVQTFMAATEAFAALAGIPIVGPVLGALAASAAIASGFVQIQNINAQQFSPGGQADSGMDSIPQALSGKSFVLSGGERVVQPTANKDLTNFLNGEKSGSGGDKPTQVNITINGKLDKQDADAAVDTMIAALRRASERGTPIISEKGVVKNGG